MITAQDIRDKTFQKASMKGGYNMDQVDEFLDELAADFSTMAKENASLKSRMRVLADKVEEYRQTEDSMRLALMSAQKMSSQIESEAREKADALVAQARETATRLTGQATAGIANEEAKLEEAKKATEKFFDHMRTVCEKQIEFYNKLSQMELVTVDDVFASAEVPPAEPAPDAAPKEAPQSEDSAVDEMVKTIETVVVESALEEPEETLEVDTELPPEEEEPTRRFVNDAAPKKKRGFDEFHFDDDI